MKNDNKLDYDQLLNLNAHLISKNKKLEAELVRRNNYIADLSHRLRTPLSAIFGMTALARRSTEDAHMLADCFDKIDFSAHMLLNTVNEILELDAVRKGNLAVHSSSFDFKLLISSVSSMCSTECGNKDIYYDVCLTSVTEETLIGDSMHLNRALMLLLMRAVQVTDSGGHVKLRITQRDINRSSVQIQFCVIDSGRALTPEEIDECSNDTGDSDIVLVKQLCQLMNGTFSFESKKGIGSVFSMTLTFGINSTAGIVTQTFLDSYRVLLVTEDEPTITSVTAVLNRIGTKCVLVSNSVQATVTLLEAVTMNKAFNLCLVDWGKSIPDGIEYTRAIRSAGSDKLKIAAITVSDSSDLQMAARTAGADQILPKPLFQSTVFNLMMELTGHEYTKLNANPNDFNFSGCKILFAEDNNLSAQITEAQLEAVGIYSDRAENGADCLDILQIAKIGYYDLILLDMKMPYMDGCETAIAIRKMELYGAKEIPIIALTADALAEDIQAAMESGMNDYIVKPIDTFQFYSTLAKYLKQKPMNYRL